MIVEKNLFISVFADLSVFKTPLRMDGWTAPGSWKSAWCGKTGQSRTNILRKASAFFAQAELGRS
jgi:hypothetical protein